MTRLALAITLIAAVLTASAWAQEAAPPPPAADAVPEQPAADAASDEADQADDAEPEQGLWIVEHLKSGGKTVWVQVALSILGLGVGIERLVNLRRGTVVPHGLAEKADRLWRSGQFAELDKLARQDKSVLGQVIGTIVQHRTLPAEQVSMLAGDVASREMRRHIQKCYPIAIVATLEPLLGLFGTVVGMIAAFDVVALAGSMGNPAILADSIAVALITTEVGLAIAIPALFLYHYLKGRASVLGIVLEETASDLVTAWKIAATPAPAAGSAAAVSGTSVGAAPTAK